MKWVGRLALTTGCLSSSWASAQDAVWKPAAPMVSMQPNRFVIVESARIAPVAAPTPPPTSVPRSNRAAMPTASPAPQWKPIQVVPSPGRLIVDPAPFPVNANDAVPTPMPKREAISPPRPLPMKKAESLPQPKPTPTPSVPTLPQTPQTRPAPTETPPPANEWTVPDSPTSNVWGAGFSEQMQEAPAVFPSAAPAKPIRLPAFGSPTISLSRDLPWLDFFGAGLLSDADSLYLNEAPATDRAFVEADYLLWWMRRGTIPTLATTSTNGGFGFLGRPGTVTLLGPGQFGESLRSGFRVRAGRWFGQDCGPNQWGIDGSFFFLGNRAAEFTANSGLFPVLTRPIFAPNINQEFGEQVAFPGVATGNLAVRLESQLWGADVNLRRSLCRTCVSRSEWFIGYRHLNLHESLDFLETITATGMQSDPAGTRILVNDHFDTKNQFHGGQLGYAMGRRLGRWDVNARASIALGVTHQELDIAGSQTRQRPGQGVQNFRGGLLAVGPNLGHFTKDEFSVVPEATINLGFAMTPNLHVHVGYNFLYWSNVARPGDQIDRVVDLSFVPNAPAVPTVLPRPQPTFTQANLRVQGIQFGAEYRW